MAGGYQAGVPDPSDTTSTDASIAGTGLTDFDDLSMYGIPDKLANLNVMFRRGEKKRVMMDTLSGEKPAYPERYNDTSEFHTFERMSQSIYRDLGPDQLGSLQLRMIAAGFYGKNPDYIPNSPDKNTYAKWQDVLKQAMRSQKTPDEVLDEAIEANGGLDAALKKHGASSASKSDIPLTHPDDIRMVAKEVSRKVLGVGWDNKQLEKFIQSYHAMEAGEGAAAQGSGAQYTRAPSLQGAVEAEARRANPTAAGATDWDNAAQMMINAFRNLSGEGVQQTGSVQQ